MRSFGGTRQEPSIGGARLTSTWTTIRRLGAAAVKRIACRILRQSSTRQLQTQRKESAHVRDEIEANLAESHWVCQKDAAFSADKLLELRTRAEL